MKRVLVFVLMSIFLASFVFAIDEPSTPGDIGEKDVEKIQSMTDKIPIDSDSGKFNASKLFGESDAEVRIKAINMWLEENAVWLKAVFGMVPSITLLFALVLYWWLWGLAQALNGVAGETIYDFAFMFRQIKGSPTDTLDLIPLSIAQVIGLVLFAFAVVLRIPFHVGKFSYHTVLGLWNYDWIGVLAVIVIFVIIAIFFPRIAKSILASIAKKREKKEKANESLDRKALHETVKGITKGEE